MNTGDQIRKGRFRCVRTGQPLVLSEDGNQLRTQDGAQSYPLADGKYPILLADEGETEKYVSSSGHMEKIQKNFDRISGHEEKTGVAPALRKIIKNNLWNRLKRNDYRNTGSVEWMRKIEGIASGETLCLSIGGGPNRLNEHFTNLNIGLFPEVDVVADAHNLPYRDATVDVIYHEAVVEHLYDPPLAVKEMKRVLKPGGMIFSNVPFMQLYHGYPYHYRNYTLTGHEYLYRQEDMEILESGVCVGPMHTFYTLNLAIMDMYFPPIIKHICKPLFKLLGTLFFRPLDKIFNHREDAYTLASSTFVVVRKQQ